MKKIILPAFILLVAGADVLSQNVGIGTTTPPIAKLEVKGDGSNNSTNNLILRNLGGDTLFRVRNDGRIGIGYNGSSYGRTVNIAGTGVNFYRTEASFGGAIFSTDTSMIMWSNSHDDNYVILQPEWGKVGIGTYGPKATLDVKGSVVLGDGGSVISKVIKLTLTKNLASVAANSASLETFTVPGAAIGSTVSISPGIALADGLLIAYARVNPVNTVEVKFMNVTSSAINHGLTAFFITVIE